MTKINNILSIIIVFLLVTILVGTLYSLVPKKIVPQKDLISQGKAVNLSAPKDNEKTAYFNLGSFRILTKKENENEEFGTILLVSPWISYSASDTIFFEEISRKKTVISGIFQDYFSQRTKTEILSKSEIKTEENLTNQINSHLSLGKIDGIYFTDFIFLE